jgi:hypothetical protein
VPRSIRRARRGRRRARRSRETLEHVLADRVEHVVAGGAAGERGRHDRLVDQRCNEIRDGRLVEAVPRCERDERRQGRAAAVNGQLLEQRLLVPVQEVVAPFHEPLQRGAGRVEAGLSRRSAARRSRMETSSASPSTFTRAAASSIASGNPSTRRAILGASATASASGSNPGRAARARSRRARRPRPRAAPRGVLTSLATWSASRLVARIRA